MRRKALIVVSAILFNGQLGVKILPVLVVDVLGLAGHRFDFREALIEMGGHLFTVLWASCAKILDLTDPANRASGTSS